METGEPVLDPSDPVYSNNVLELIEEMINTVVRNSAPDAIKRLSKLSKVALSCVRLKEKSIISYTGRFLLPARSYLNLTNADHHYHESQNLAVSLLSNANLSQNAYASVMVSMVSTIKGKNNSVEDQISIERKRAD